MSERVDRAAEPGSEQAPAPHQAGPGTIPAELERTLAQPLLLAPDYAALIQRYPKHLHQIMAAVHERYGNGVASEVSLLLRPSASSQLLQEGMVAHRLSTVGTPAPAGDPRDRSAEFAPVPADRQVDVRLHIRGDLTAKLAAARPDIERFAPLVNMVGNDQFYAAVARFDPPHAAMWLDMVKVQAEFAAAESGYDPRTRAYSESMRLTLHAMAVLHLAQGTQELYRAFVGNHVTAFRENGGWFTNLEIGLGGAVDVMANTPVRMGRELPTLVEHSTRQDPMTAVAAEMVREARRSATANKE